MKTLKNILLEKYNEDPRVVDQMNMEWRSLERYIPNIDDWEEIERGNQYEYIGVIEGFNKYLGFKKNYPCFCIRIIWDSTPGNFITKMWLAEGEKRTRRPGEPLEGQIEFEIPVKCDETYPVNHIRNGIAPLFKDKDTFLKWFTKSAKKAKVL